ncbi:MAG: histidinol dehydrogenase, partial [Coriobacteriia bacterium]|nr:histidinol dehydrogenase [Coriobacteriia bacterium]
MATPTEQLPHERRRQPARQSGQPGTMRDVFASAALRRVLVAATLAAMSSASSLIAPATAASDPLSPAMYHALDVAAAKTASTHRTVAPARYPYYTVGDAWRVVPPHLWGAGYLPGSLWYMYQLKGDQRWRTWAVQRQKPIGAYAGDTGKPDVGVLVLNTYRHAYRLTGDAAYRHVALTGSGSLAGHYDSRIGMVRARTSPYEFTVVADNIMNVELLFWGTGNGGPRAWREMATNHALRTAKDFIRPDGGSYHYVSYSPKTGAVIAKGQAQGAFTESTWSRGQAWLIYGFASAYRETGDSRLLDAARRTTDYWASRVPADLVPYWDFDAPNIPNAPRDSSAAAVAAAGFVELARLDPDPNRRASFLDLATRTLESLSSAEYLAEGAPEPSVLLHGTWAANGGYADHGTSWGDYFFIEALMRLRTQVLRLSGPDRYRTAVRASQVGFESADAVVIAGGGDFADALAATSLAGIHEGPVLLSDPRRLPGEVRQEIRRLGATRAYVVGGQPAISESVAAEHGPDSQVILVTDAPDLGEQVQIEVRRLLATLTRAETTAKALEHAAIVTVADIDQAVEVSERYAPEHLIIQTREADKVAARVTTAGSVFVGHLTPEALGDYISG